MEKLYGIVMGKCTESQIPEIKGEDNYEDAEMDSNKPGKSLDAFQKQFRSAVQTLELAGGIKVFLPMLKTIGVLKYTEADAISDEAKVDVKKKVIKQARDKAWKEQVMIDEASELGRDEFPITLTAAFDMLVIKEHQVIEAHQQSNQYCDGQNGVSFVQGGGNGNGTGHSGQDGR
eukprot:12848159-Ditylum_brightwellii.AAC.1